MGIKDLLALAGKLEHIRGVERDLRLRKRNGLLLTLATTLLGIIGILTELRGEGLGAYLARVWTHTRIALAYLGETLRTVFGRQWDELYLAPPQYDVLGFYLVVLGIVVYIITRHTAFLFTQSEQPFHYTVWIARFIRAEDREENSTLIKADDEIHHLLHHDLLEKLNQRIGRFSVLDEQHLDRDGDAGADTPPSHIHVDGYYAIRQGGDGRDVRRVQVMPRVRIGPPGSPSILTQPVEMELRTSKTGHTLDGEYYDYPQLVEQVYSKVASAIYGQLRTDIEAKLDLFPSDYLRAVALYREAADFLRSNTIDSYDYAIELFRKALRYYNTSLRSLAAQVLIRLRFPRIGIDYELRHARTRIEYAKSLIFRYRVSSLTGRTRNSLYGVCDDLNRVTRRLECVHRKFHLRRWRLSPARQDGGAQIHEEAARHRQLALAALTSRDDSWVGRHVLRRPRAAQFDECRELMFESHVVLGLAYASLNATTPIEQSLRRAEGSAPGRSEHSALFSVTRAEAEPNIEAKIPLLVRATELEPMFEIARYLLAEYSLWQFLRRGELEQERERVGPVTQAFERVFQINPGNIASHAHLGYLHWLLGDLEMASEHFRRGAETKTIVQQTFTGELNYGVARIAAEQGDFTACYDRYTEALSSEPALGSYAPDGGSRQGRGVSSYQYMSQAMLDRYARFRSRVEDRIRAVFAPIDGDDVVDPDALVAHLEKEGFARPPEYADAGSDAGRTAECAARMLNDMLEDADLMKRLIRLHPASEGILMTIRAGTLSQFTARELATRRVHRALLDHLYQPHLRRCGDVQYFETLQTTRRLLGTVSATTLNRVYSCVLNDYANACLSFFHRHGSRQELRNAIDAYTRATRANPSNAIAFSNLENAEGWEATMGWRPNDIDAFRQRMGHLEKADQLLRPSWSKVKIGLARYRLGEARFDIDARTRELREPEQEAARQHARVEEVKSLVAAQQARVNEKVRRLEQRRRSEPGRAAAAQRTTLLDTLVPDERQAELSKDVAARRPGRSALTQPMEGVRSALSVERDDELTQLERGLTTLKNQLLQAQASSNEADETLAQARASLDEARQKFELAFARAVETAVRGSRFASIIEVGRRFRLSSIDALTKARIRGDRLDQADLEALVSVADHLSSHRDDRRRLEACVALADFVGRYVPESFDVNTVLLEAYRNLRRLDLQTACAEFGAETVLGATAAAELPDSAEGARVLKATLDSLIDRRSTSLVDPADVSRPARVLQRLEEPHVRAAVAGSVALSDELAALRKLTPRRSLIPRLASFLNSVIGNPLDAEHILDPDLLGRRTRSLIGTDGEPRRLRGPDLEKLNRRILNEMLSPWMEESRVERVLDSFRTTVRAWLAEDPIHFLALAHWAVEYLTYPEYEKALTRALDLDPPHDGWLHEKLAELYQRTGYEDLAEEKLKRAIDTYAQPAYRIGLARRLSSDGRFDEAVELLRPADTPTVRDTLIQILQAQIAHVMESGHWNVAVARAEAALAEFPDEFAQTRDEVRRRFDHHRISQHYGEKWADQLLVVTPVALEVAGNLIPYVEGEGGGVDPELMEVIERMQSDVRSRIGVSIPGVRFRGNETDLPDGTYIIMLNEIPVASGNISTDRRFLPSKIPPTSAGPYEQGADPLTGATGYWVPAGQPAAAPTWKLMEYPVRHLESVLRRNLVDFFGIQETVLLLEVEYADRAEHYATNPHELERLSAVLKGLIADQVPLLPLRPIVDEFERRAAGDGTTRIIERIRSLPSVRAQVPGRDANVLYRAGPSFEDSFRNSLHGHGEMRVLAMSPDAAQEVLTAVRYRVGDCRSVAIVVEDAALRPYIRRLLQIEFPRVFVLAMAELDLPKHALRRLDVVELPEKELVHA